MWIKSRKNVYIATNDSQEQTRERQKKYIECGPDVNLASLGSSICSDDLGYLAQDKSWENIRENVF